MLYINQNPFQVNPMGVSGREEGISFHFSEWLINENLKHIQI